MYELEKGMLHFAVRLSVFLNNPTAICYFHVHVSCSQRACNEYGFMHTRGLYPIRLSANSNLTQI